MSCFLICLLWEFLPLIIPFLLHIICFSFLPGSFPRLTNMFEPLDPKTKQKTETECLIHSHRLLSSLDTGSHLAIHSPYDFPLKGLKRDHIPVVCHREGRTSRAFMLFIHSCDIRQSHQSQVLVQKFSQGHTRRKSTSQPPKCERGHPKVEASSRGYPPESPGGPGK